MVGDSGRTPDLQAMTKWVMKFAPAWIGLCLGWFAAIACYYGLNQGPLVFLALPAIGYIIGIHVGKRIKSPDE